MMTLACTMGSDAWNGASTLTKGSTGSREMLAREAKLSGNQVTLIEKIQKHAAPEFVAAIRSGTISINAAAAVASLPEDEQRDVFET